MPQTDNDRTVSRDLAATAVPYGETITIPKGAKVTITHRLGGNFTVVWAQGMARIESKDTDAIGEETQPEPATEKEAQTSADAHEGPPDEQAVWTALKEVFDPEIPVNIVDLGLVYSVETKEAEQGGYLVEVAMTLTAPGCGMGPMIAQDAEYKITQVPGVSHATVELVWDPPWHQEMISDEGKMQLGLV